MGRLNIVITDCDLGSTAREQSLLEEHLEATVTVASCRTEADVLAATEGADAVIVQWAPITRAVIAGMPGCRAISRYGIGVDMIDLDAAASAGIPVLNVPHYCVEEVASHAVAMLLSLWRRIPELDASVRSGEWAVGDLVGAPPLSQATLGLVGLGRIARLVAGPLAAMGAGVIAHDPYAEDDGDVPLVELAELAANADLISLHCPLTAETSHLVDDAFLDLVKPGAVLVNTSRGGLVDSRALHRALSDGRLAGAGLDVFDVEPLPAEHILRSTPRLLLTPHAAWCSAAALPTLQAEAAWNLIRHLRDVDAPA